MGVCSVYFGADFVGIESFVVWIYSELNGKRKGEVMRRWITRLSKIKTRRESERKKEEERYDWVTMMQADLLYVKKKNI